MTLTIRESLPSDKKSNGLAEGQFWPCMRR